jgi:EmrB/QacA subfamily drug resistance transporter
MTMPVAAWLTGRFGERRVFVLALSLFVLASAQCGTAQSLAELVVLRFVQGAAGGLIGPVATAMLYRTYPQNERARMTRLLLMPIALGPALAPPLGGFLVDHLSWRFAFFLNAPVGLLTAGMVLLGLPADRGARAGRLGLANFAAAAAGLAGALYVLGEGPQIGWGSPALIAVAALTVAAGALFVAIELRAANPLIDLRLLRDPLFRHSNLATAFQTMAFLGGLLYVTPLMLQQLGGRSPTTAGLVLAVVPAGVVISSQTVGRAFDVIGPRVLVVLGQLLLAVDLLVVSRFGGKTPLWAFCAAMLFAGLSNGMGMVGLQASMFARIPDASIPKAATALNVNRQVATALGVGVATAVLTSAGVGGVGGVGASAAAAGSAGRPFHIAFLVTAACSAAAALSATALPRRLAPADELSAAAPDALTEAGAVSTAR